MFHKNDELIILCMSYQVHETIGAINVLISFSTNDKVNYKTNQPWLLTTQRCQNGTNILNSGFDHTGE